MKKFLRRFISFIFLLIVLVFFGIFITTKGINFGNIPKNNVSNSSCFRAKIDHAISNDYFKKCTFLISGSSMSLNNISGRIIQERTLEDVYNVSSFGTKPRETIGLLNHNITGSQVEYLLVAFNNCDFGDFNNISVDYSATEDFINGSSLSRSWIFLKTFNMTTFFSDLDERAHYSDVVNNYKSLCFDETGSIELIREGFIIDKERWAEYMDTTGFKIFYNDVIQLNTICEKSNVTLFLIYLPFRRDLLTENYLMQNLEVSNILEEKLGTNFIDLSNVEISSDDYCDYAHLFKEGADYITNLILDSLQLQNIQLYKD